MENTCLYTTSTRRGRDDNDRVLFPDDITEDISLEMRRFVTTVSSVAKSEIARTL